MSRIHSKTVGLFTPNEHAILAQWFGMQTPESAQCLDVSEAIKQLGYCL